MCQNCGMHSVLHITCVSYRHVLVVIDQYNNMTSMILLFYCVEVGVEFCMILLYYYCVEVYKRR